MDDRSVLPSRAGRRPGRREHPLERDCRHSLSGDRCCGRIDCWAQVGSGSNDRQQPARNDHNNSKQPNNGKIRFGSNASTSLTGVGADDSTCDTAIIVASRREATFGFMKSDGLSHLGAAPRDRVTASHQVAPAFGAMGGTPARLSWAFKSARTGVLAASLARVS